MLLEVEMLSVFPRRLPATFMTVKMPGGLWSLFILIVNPIGLIYGLPMGYESFESRCSRLLTTSGAYV